MLTADLAQSWQRGERTGPAYINPLNPDYLRDAADLINLFHAHEGHTRGELEQALQEYVGVGTDYKILRGLSKLLMDRCTFEVAAPVDPIDIRRALFLKARLSHPVIGEEAVRMQIVSEVARELACDSGVVLGSLYADLPEKQKLVNFEPLTDRELLDLYNLAQAQALLYRCVEMRLWVEPQNPEAYRELFGAIKAYRLIHTIKGGSSTGYEIRLDGPVSIFHHSQKYGIQMAVFLPALLLLTGWRMKAEIAQKLDHKNRGRAFFELHSQQQQLRSHYLPAMPYENPTVERLVQRWEKFESPWSLAPSTAVIDLGESAFVPDFVLTHRAGHQVYLEILGFWTPRLLEERWKEFQHAGMKNFILAAWDELRGSREPLTHIPPQTIIFKRNLEPAAVELAINQLTSPETPAPPVNEA